MAIEQILRQEIKQIKSAMRNGVKRSKISLAGNDDGKYQISQVNYFGIKTKNTHIINPYGLASNPSENEEGLMFNVMGQEENTAIIPYAVKSRFKGLQKGEVRVGNPLSSASVLFRNDGVASINGSEFEGIPKIVELTTKLNALVTDYNLHTHSGVQTGAGISGVPTVTTNTFSKSDYENTNVLHGQQGTGTSGGAGGAGGTVEWGNITGTLSNQADLQAALDAKLSAETDPIFSASPAFGISASDITNWNTAYGWGDHAGLYDLIGTASGLISTHESTYNHSLIATALQNIVEDTTPQLGGDLDAQNYDINNITDIDISGFLKDGTNSVKVSQIVDKNTAISITVGSGGDYATFAEAIASVPDMIADDVTITILDGTTLTEEVNVSNKHGLIANKEITITAETYYPNTPSTQPTADSATATTLRDTSVFTIDDQYNDCWVLIVDGTGTDNGFVQITDTIASSGDIVVSSWSGTQPDNTSKYMIVGALVDCQGTQQYGVNLLANTVITRVYGIGVKDADEYGIQVQRCIEGDIYYSASYGSDRSGINVAASNNSNIWNCASVNCNTDNNAGNAGIRNNSAVVAYILNCALSDNNQYGILTRFGGYTLAQNNIGDNNGTYGIYASSSGFYTYSGTTPTGSSGSVGGIWNFYGNAGFGIATPLERVHSSAKVRADSVFNVNGTDGVSGTFTTADAKTVTVTGGIITSIV